MALDNNLSNPSRNEEETESRNVDPTRRALWRGAGYSGSGLGPSEGVTTATPDGLIDYRGRRISSGLGNYASAIENQFGLTLSGGHRTPERNQELVDDPRYEASPNSRHMLAGDQGALDFVGSEEDLQRAAEWAREQGAREVLVHGSGSTRHLHVAWDNDGPRGDRNTPEQTEPSWRGAPDTAVGTGDDTVYTAPTRLVEGQARGATPRASDYPYIQGSSVFNPRLRDMNARAQPFWDKAGAGLAQTVGVLTGGTVAGFGYLFEIPDMIAMWQGHDRQLGNWLTQAGEGFEDWVAGRASELYTREATDRGLFSGGVRPGNIWEYVFSRLPSLASTVTMLAPGLGVGRITGAGGRMLARGSRLATRGADRTSDLVEGASRVTRSGGRGGDALDAASGATRAVRRGEAGGDYARIARAERLSASVGGALAMRSIENIMQGSELYQDIVSRERDRLSELYSNDEISTADYISGLDEANEKARRAASRTMALGFSLLAVDMFQMAQILKPVNHVNRALSASLVKITPNADTNPVIRRLIEKATLNQTITSADAAAAGMTRGEFRRMLAGQFFTEGFEEGAQEFFMKEGELALLDSDDISPLVDRVWDHLKDPMTWDVALWGGIGGMLFGSIGRIGGQKLMKNEAERQAIILESLTMRAANAQNLLKFEALAKATEGVGVLTGAEGLTKFIRDGGEAKVAEIGIMEGTLEYDIAMYDAISQMTNEELVEAGFHEGAQERAAEIRDSLRNIESNFNHIMDNNSWDRYGLNEAERLLLGTEVAKDAHMIDASQRFLDTLRATVSEIQSDPTKAALQGNRIGDLNKAIEKQEARIQELRQNIESLSTREGAEKWLKERAKEASKALVDGKEKIDSAESDDQAQENAARTRESGPSAAEGATTGEPSDVSSGADAATADPSIPMTPEGAQELGDIDIEGEADMASSEPAAPPQEADSPVEYPEGSSVSYKGESWNIVRETRPGRFTLERNGKKVTNVKGENLSLQELPDEGLREVTPDEVGESSRDAASQDQQASENEGSTVSPDESAVDTGESSTGTGVVPTGPLDQKGKFDDQGAATPDIQEVTEPAGSAVSDTSVKAEDRPQETSPPDTDADTDADAEISPAYELNWKSDLKTFVATRLYMWRNRAKRGQRVKVSVDTGESALGASRRSGALTSEATAIIKMGGTIEMNSEGEFRIRHGDLSADIDPLAIPMRAEFMEDGKVATIGGSPVWMWLKSTFDSSHMSPAERQSARATRAALYNAVNDGLNPNMEIRRIGDGLVQSNPSGSKPKNNPRLLLEQTGETGELAMVSSEGYLMIGQDKRNPMPGRSNEWRDTGSARVGSMVLVITDKNGKKYRHPLTREKVGVERATLGYALALMKMEGATGHVQISAEQAEQMGIPGPVEGNIDDLISLLFYDSEGGARAKIQSGDMSKAVTAFHVRNGVLYAGGKEYRNAESIRADRDAIIRSVANNIFHAIHSDGLGNELGSIIQGQGVTIFGREYTRESSYDNFLYDEGAVTSDIPMSVAGTPIESLITQRQVAIGPVSERVSEETAIAEPGTSVEYQGETWTIVQQTPSGRITIEKDGTKRSVGPNSLSVITVPDTSVQVTEEVAPDPPVGSRVFAEPVEGVSEIVQGYKDSKEIDTTEGMPIHQLDESNSMAIADAFEAMEDNPNDPEVKAAYEAMATETLEQYQAIADAGIVVEVFDGDGEPYASSREMLDDLRNNNHLYVLSTEKEFGQTGITDEMRENNPLLVDSGIVDVNGVPLLVNDVFRFVHDVFGHGERGNSFGPIGEENAWDVHARMYSPLARRAMTTETRGQNSWVNFGPHMRNAEGQLVKKGEDGYIPITERPFAEQKIGLLPEEYSEIIAEKPFTATVEEVSASAPESDVSISPAESLDGEGSLGTPPQSASASPQSRTTPAEPTQQQRDLAQEIVEAIAPLNRMQRQRPQFIAPALRARGFSVTEITFDLDSPVIPRVYSDGSRGDGMASPIGALLISRGGQDFIIIPSARSIDFRLDATGLGYSNAPSAHLNGIVLGEGVEVGVVGKKTSDSIDIIGIIGGDAGFQGSPRYSRTSNGWHPVQHRAFHGSPALYLEASLDYVLSGEGNLTQGYGLYLSGARDVVSMHYVNEGWVRRKAHQIGQAQPTEYEFTVPSVSEGSHFHWDLPIQKQGSHVAEAFVAAIEQFSEGYARAARAQIRQGATGESLYNLLVEAVGGPDGLMVDIFEYRQRASEALLEQGIVGNVYFTGEMRHDPKRDPTNIEHHNIVLFDVSRAEMVGVNGSPLVSGEQEVQAIRDLLGDDIAIEVVEGLINVEGGGTAFGVFRKALIQLAARVREGTGFHEAFHAVFNTYLNPEERAQAIREAEEVGVANNPTYISHVELGLSHELAVEEVIAEQFRAFMLADGDQSMLDRMGYGTRVTTESIGGSIVSRFFNRVWNTLRAALGFNSESMMTWNEVVSGQRSIQVTPTVNSLFNRIATGGYRNAAPIPSNSAIEMYSRVSPINDANTAELSDFLLAQVARNLEVGRMLSSSDLQALKASLTEDINLTTDRMVDEGSPYADGWVHAREAIDKMISDDGRSGLLVERFRAMGLVAQDRFGSEEVSSRTRLPYQTSNKERNGHVLAWISSLPRVRESYVTEAVEEGRVNPSRDSMVIPEGSALGVAQRMDADVVWVRLENILKDMPQRVDADGNVENAFDLMMARIKDAGLTDPDIMQVFMRLSDPATPESTKTAFYHAFNLVDQGHKTDVWNKTEDGIQYVTVDAMSDSEQARILSEWERAFSRSSILGDTVNTERLQRIWNYWKGGSGATVMRRLRNMKGDPDLTDTIARNIRTILNSIGIEVSQEAYEAYLSRDGSYVENVERLARHLDAYVFGSPDRFGSIMGLLGDDISPAQVQAMKESPPTMNSSAIRELAQFEAAQSELASEPSAVTTQGTVSANSLRSSWLNRILNLSDPDNPIVNALSAIPMFRRSRTYKVWKNNPGLRSRFRNVTQTVREKGESGENQVRTPDEMARYMNGVLRGILGYDPVYPAITQSGTSDSSDFKAVMGIPGFEIGVFAFEADGTMVSGGNIAAVDQMIQYFLAELDTALLNHREIMSGRSPLIKNFSPEIVREYKKWRTNVRKGQITPPPVSVGRAVQSNLFPSLNFHVLMETRPDLAELIYRSNGLPSDAMNVEAVFRGLRPLVWNMMRERYVETINKLSESLMVTSTPQGRLIERSAFIDDAIMREYVGRYGEDFALQTAVADFVVNSMMGSIEQQALLYGDFAAYSEQGALTEAGRLQDAGVGLRPDVVPDSYSMVVSRGLPDGMAYITPSRWRDLMKGLGLWRSEMDAEFDLMVSGEPFNEAILTMQPIRLDHRSIELLDGKAIPMIASYTAVVATPGSTGQMGEALAAMTRNGVDQIVSESSIVTGYAAPHDFSFVVGEEGRVSAYSLPNDGVFVSEAPVPRGMSQIAQGTQAPKLVMGAIDPDGVVIIDGKEFSGEEAIRQISDALEDGVRAALSSYESSLGVTITDFGVDTPGDFVERVIKEIASSNLPTDVLDAMSSVLDGFAAPLTAIPGRSQILASILESFRQQVIQPSVPGGVLTIVPGTAVPDGTVMLADSMGEGDILIPRLPGMEGMTDEQIQGMSNLGLRAFAYQLPSTDATQISGFRVAGFLPSHMGDSAVVGRPVFDIGRSLFVMTPDVQIESGVATMADSHHNKMMEVMSNYTPTHTAIRQVILDRAREMADILNEESFWADDLGYVTPMAVVNARKLEVEAQVLPGMIEYHVSDVHLSRMADISVAFSGDARGIFPSGIDGMIAMDSTDGSNQALSELMEGARQYASDPWLRHIGITPATATAAMFMIRAGIPVHVVIDFMSQPVIRDVIRVTDAYGAEITGSNRTLDQAIDALMKDYGRLLKRAKEDGDVLPLRDTRRRLNTKEYYRTQIAVLSTFREMVTGPARGFRDSVVATRLEQQVGTNLAGLIVAQEAFNRFDGAAVLVDGFDRKVTATYVAAYYDALKHLIGDWRRGVPGILSNLFTEATPWSIEQIVGMANQMGVTSITDRNLDLISRIEREITAAILANSNLMPKGAELRALIKGPDSIATRLDRLKQDPAVADNPIIRSLLVKDDPSGLQLVIGKSGRIDHARLIQGLNELASMGGEYTRFAQDLTRYTLVTTANNPHLFNSSRLGLMSSYSEVGHAGFLSTVHQQAQAGESLPYSLSDVLRSMSDFPRAVRRIHPRQMGKVAMKFTVNNRNETKGILIAADQAKAINLAIGVTGEGSFAYSPIISFNNQLYEWIGNDQNHNAAYVARQRLGSQTESGVRIYESGTSVLADSGLDTSESAANRIAVSYKVIHRPAPPVSPVVESSEELMTDWIDDAESRKRACE